MRKTGFIISSLTLAVLSLICYTQLTIFIVPPIGAIPEGVTLVILRMNNTQFIDSPDSLCERIQGGVNLFCRGMAIGAIGKNSKILIRLPYNESLYLLSTSGKTFQR